MIDDAELLRRYVASARRAPSPSWCNAQAGLIVSFTIRDTQGYLDALGKPRIARVKRDAQIAQAEADRDAAIRTAQASQAGQEAKFAADSKIAKTEKMVISSNGSGPGGGASKLTGDVTTILSQLPPVLESLTGTKFEKLLEQVPALKNAMDKKEP